MNVDDCLRFLLDLARHPDNMPYCRLVHRRETFEAIVIMYANFARICEVPARNSMKPFIELCLTNDKSVYTREC